MDGPKNFENEKDVIIGDDSDLNEGNILEKVKEETPEAQEMYEDEVCSTPQFEFVNVSNMLMEDIKVKVENEDVESISSELQSENTDSIETEHAATSGEMNIKISDPDADANADGLVSQSLDAESHEEVLSNEAFLGGPIATDNQHAGVLDSQVQYSGIGQYDTAGNENNTSSDDETFVGPSVCDFLETSFYIKDEVPLEESSVDSEKEENEDDEVSVMRDTTSANSIDEGQMGRKTDFTVGNFESERSISLNIYSGGNEQHKITGKSYKCSLCCKLFKSKHVLSSHLKTHKEEWPLKCSQCAMAFPDSSQLLGHMRMHTDEKPFKCSVCEMSFTTNGTLKVHMRKHTGEKPFNCSHCEKAFATSSNLKTHMHKHTGEKPFKCSHCEMAFSCSSTLIKHTRKHTGEKPYKCSQCGEAFTQSGTLKMHMRKHTGEKPFKCVQCEMTFSGKGHLNVHMRKHTGVKPYRCNQCDTAFSCSSTLKRHMFKHTRESPYKCNSCGKAFSGSSKLRVHERKHNRKTSQV